MFIRSTGLKVLFRVTSLLLCSLLVPSTFEIGVLVSFSFYILFIILSLSATGFEVIFRYTNL